MIGYLGFHRMCVVLDGYYRDFKIVRALRIILGAR